MVISTLICYEPCTRGLFYIKALVKVYQKGTKQLPFYYTKDYIGCQVKSGRYIIFKWIKPITLSTQNGPLFFMKRRAAIQRLYHALGHCYWNLGFKKILDRI